MNSLYSLTLLFHSTVRYFVLIAMLVTIYRSIIALVQGKSFGPLDEKLSVWLLIMAHTQLILGLVLYGISPAVIFSAASMKDPGTRYWLVEHITTMIIAVILITLSRVTTKNLTDDAKKHRRVLIYNVLAGLLILMAIQMSGRGFLGLPI
ncbi:MAG: cytochrome B [Bacteroidetes bacterium]|nr:cytochrome B [Bacteroidota bacterium]